MSSLAKLYDLSSVICTVAGVIVAGFAEEGGIDAQPMADRGEWTTGATGESVFSRSNNKDWTIEITCLETSKTYKQLAALMQAQDLAMDGFTLVPLPFLMIDQVNGDRIGAAGIVFLTSPGMNKAKKVGERVFKLGVPSPLVSFGTSNAN